MNSKKLLYIGVTAVLVLSVLAIFTAGASAEDYTFVTKWGSSGSGDGEFHWPHGIAVDSSGYVYVADSGNDRIQKFDSVGTFITKWGSSGTGDGEFGYPMGIAVDSSGYVFVADTGNHRIQKFDSDGNFITKWGSSGTGDGEFDWPCGIAVDSSGYVYVADRYNYRIQKFDSDGTFITKWGSSGTGDGEFDDPMGIAVDSSGYVYVADIFNNRIQKFDSVGNFITKWGSYGPCGIAVDSSGYVYVTDSLNNRIQKFDSVGNFITKWGNYGTGDGEFYWPYGIAVDSSGYVYVADTSNYRIQKFAPGIPEEPLLSFTPSSHDFGDKCEGETDSTTFAIWNSGAGTLTYSLSESCGWVEVNPTSGSSTGEHDTITVDIDTTGLSEGPHTCDISVSSNGGSGMFTVTVNVVPLCTAKYAVYQAGVPDPEGILNPLRELRDDYLKEEYVDRYYDYCPELTVVVTRDPALAYEAARLLVKYSPMVKHKVNGIGMDKLITRRDVQEIVSVTNRLKRGVWKNRDEIGVERSLEIIKFLDEFKGQIRASEGKTFSEALPGSIYCEDEQMPDPDG